MAASGSLALRQSLHARLRRRARTMSRLETVCAVIVAILLLLTLIGPWVAPHPTEAPDPGNRLVGPSLSHPMGTDENGTDILSRVIAAPRTDVFVALVATLIAVAIGAPLGVLAGYFEGSRRRVASLFGETILRLLDVIQAFPVFILALVLVAIRGADQINIIMAIAFVNVPVFLRLVRAEILTLRERPFTEAARAVGNSDLRIGFRHLLPNALPPLIVQLSVTVGFAILLTAGLSFVGAGVRPPTPELGGMVASGARFMILGQWWPALFPGIALGLVVFSFAVVGELLGRLLSPGGDRDGRVPTATAPLAEEARLEQDLHGSRS
jgi:peptide/nickel transport system permease protein